MTVEAERHESITLGGGCFWCVEAGLQALEGVFDVQSGYAGGAHPAPTYREVCAGTTGHAEVVRVRFDPEVLPLEELLTAFFTLHDPTTLNRQGADVGTQYRSVILWESPEQEPVAREVIRDLEAQGLWGKPVVTEIAPLRRFHQAEDYHDDYYRRNPEQPYCQVVINPKLAKLRERFGHRMR